MNTSCVLFSISQIPLAAFLPQVIQFIEQFSHYIGVQNDPYIQQMITVLCSPMVKLYITVTFELFLK